MTLPRVQSRASRGPARGPKVHLVTFGCQMNKYDSLLVEGRFKAHGYSVVEDLGQADVVVFNTCSVRDHAEERTYSWLGELRREKERRPDMIVGVMGCMAQRAEDEVFRRANHVDIVCGTRRFQHLPELVEEVRTRRESPERAARAQARILDTDMGVEVAVDRMGEEYVGGLEGYLAVMRGCDLNCTYCVVPRTRGRVQSRPIDDLVTEARWMVDQGARAITLLGQTVNSYGEDLAPVPEGRGRRGRPGLADLIRELQEIDDLARIRLITLHPSYVTRELAEAIRDCDKADRFLPLPAQSGSDDVLRRMKRGYTTDLYRRRVDLLRDAVEDIELGSDWIVGFPGETDADFALSESFLGEIGFVQNYVFKYDPRPDTAAHERIDDIAAAVKKERNQALLRASERASLAVMERRIGSLESVFVSAVSDKNSEVVLGRTRHNLPVSFPGTSDLVGREVPVKIQEASPYGLAGELELPVSANS